MIDPNQKLFAHLELQQLSASQSSDSLSDLKNSLFKSFDGNTELKMKIKLARDNSFYFYPNMIQTLHTARLLKFNKFSIQILNRTELKNIDLYLKEIKNSLSINIFVNFQSALQIFKLQGKEPPFEKKNEATINNDFVNISLENNYINICVEPQIVNKNLAVRPFKLCTSKDHSLDFFDTIIRQMEVEFTLNGTKFKEKKSILLIDAKSLKDPNCKWLSDRDTIEIFFLNLRNMQFKEMDGDKSILNQTPSLIRDETLEKKEILDRKNPLKRKLTEHDNNFNKKIKINSIKSCDSPKLNINKNKIITSPDLDSEMLEQHEILKSNSSNQQSALQLKIDFFRFIENSNQDIKIRLKHDGDFYFCPNMVLTAPHSKSYKINKFFIEILNKKKFNLLDEQSFNVFDEQSCKILDEQLAEIKKNLTIKIFVNHKCIHKNSELTGEDSELTGEDSEFSKQTEVIIDNKHVNVSMFNNYINICVKEQSVEKKLAINPLVLRPNKDYKNFDDKVIRQIDVRFTLNGVKFNAKRPVILIDEKSFKNPNCKWLTDTNTIQNLFSNLNKMEFSEKYANAS